MYNILTQKGQHSPATFHALINPLDTEESLKKTEADIKKIDVPAYTGASGYVYTYKCHLQGCQNFFNLLKGTKKILFPGPSALYLHAPIDQDDTNWIVILKDVGPDVSVRTAREGENQVPQNLPKRELTRGWLKATHRALDPERSKPWKPRHPFTKEAQKTVVPSEIDEYAVEILATANLFKKGHRICIDITSVDMSTGTAFFTNVEYIPYHIRSSRTTLHKIYHSEIHPSFFCCFQSSQLKILKELEICVKKGVERCLPLRSRLI